MRAFVVALVLLAGCKDESRWWCVNGDGLCFRNKDRCEATLTGAAWCGARDVAWCNDGKCLGGLNACERVKPGCVEKR